jgi:hypothetical protein
MILVRVVVVPTMPMPVIRPCQRIDDPPAIAGAFACAVTVSAHHDSLLARNGGLSLFSAYNEIFPEASDFPRCNTKAKPSELIRFLPRRAVKDREGILSKERLLIPNSTNSCRPSTASNALEQGRNISQGTTFFLSLLRLSSAALIS